jgi:hypothetical protein
MPNAKRVARHTSTLRRTSARRTSSKSTPKRKTLSPAQRRAAAQLAAKNAWIFMHSKPYQAIKNNSKLSKNAKRKAIDALKAKRAA